MSQRSKRQAKKRKDRLKRKQQRILKIKAKKSPKETLTHADEVTMAELETIIERSAQGPLGEQERELLLGVSQTLHFLTEQLEKKTTSIGRLRKLLFGAGTESLKNLDSKKTEQPLEEAQDNPSDDQAPETSDKKPKGHGRNGAQAYTGAKKVNIPHQTLKPGDPCPNCLKGTLYEMAKPKRTVRVTGQAPLEATVYEQQKLRCGLCDTIFTAEAPKDIGPEKYDAESVSMIALLKYGTGVPFNRLERLQKTLGIPLAASTQWETLSKHEHAFHSVYDEFIIASAQGKILHNDDTTMKVLELADLKRADTANSDRTGIFTSGIVSVDDDHQIALFFTGHQHAGENLADILRHRAAELNTPIQMSDALSRNAPGDFKTLVANCLAHGRRKFVDVYKAFPEECHTVLEILAKVYKHDAYARTHRLSDPDRLSYHQRHSASLMAELKDWMTEQIDSHLVEPNSGLGEAISYMLNHWEKLTLFLREPGAPLDNNLCERALKKAILHRKNAYFYKTANGARVGDMFMSLIHTCELNTVNPFDYLTQIQKHSDSVHSDPTSWMPWNYQETRQKLDNAAIN